VKKHFEYAERQTDRQTDEATDTSTDNKGRYSSRKLKLCQCTAGTQLSGGV